MDLFSLQERSRQVEEVLPDSDRINQDFRPRAYLLQMEFWLSHFNTNFWMPVILLIILILIAGLRSGPLEIGIFVAGFTGTSAELILLIGIQVVFGYIYLYLSIIVTVFMSGLAAGALMVNKLPGKITHRKFRSLQAFLAVLTGLLALVFLWMERTQLPEILLHILFNSFTFLVASATGLLFAAAALLRRSGIASTASRLYSTDLAGSAGGALLTSILLIPLLGLRGSLILILGINGLAVLYSWMRQKVI